MKGEEKNPIVDQARRESEALDEIGVELRPSNYQPTNEEDEDQNDDMVVDERMENTKEGVSLD